MGNEQTYEEQVEMGLRLHGERGDKGKKDRKQMQSDANRHTQKKEKITLVEHKWIVTYNFTYMHSLNHAPVQRWGIGTRRG